jgi:hypothetical protein
MKRINKKGFSKVEFMTILGLLAILIAVGAKMAVDTRSNYSVYKTLAANFMKSVGHFKDKYTNDNNIYYLNELIEKGYSGEIQDPDNPTEYCDKYESYVAVPSPNDKRVFLYCSEYIVEGTQYNGYKIYKVSEWQDEKTQKTNDAAMLYNYKENGNLVFGEYYSEKTFIQKYFEKTQVPLTSPFQLKENLSTKTVYREKTLVKELK